MRLRRSRITFHSPDIWLGEPWDVRQGRGSIWVGAQGLDRLVRIDPADASVMAASNWGSPSPPTR